MITGNEFFTTYNQIYQKYQLLPDKEIIANWKHHQYKSTHKEDYDWIAFSVCEDLLRQRGNTYIDTTYPRD